MGWHTNDKVPETWRLDRLDDEDDDDDEEEEDDGEKRGGRANRDSMPPMAQQTLYKAGVLFLGRVIDDRTATAAMAGLLAMEQEDPTKIITVIVNTPGGSADSGFGIYDVMRFIRNPVRTVCAGLCASAGILVFLGADKGMRFTLPHARFMIHQPSTASQGQASDIEITAREIVKTREKAYELISRETGVEIEKLKKDSRRDFWLSAQEAVDYNLADKIITSSTEW